MKNCIANTRAAGFRDRACLPQNDQERDQPVQTRMRHARLEDPLRSIRSSHSPGQRPRATFRLELSSDFRPRCYDRGSITHERGPRGPRSLFHLNCCWLFGPTEVVPCYKATKSSRRSFDSPSLRSGSLRMTAKSGAHGSMPWLVRCRRRGRSGFRGRWPGTLPWEVFRRLRRRGWRAGRRIPC